MKDKFYKIKKDRVDYKGQRFFRFNPASEKTLQVVVFPGDEKKGKSNCVGVYMIHRMTFLSNYFMYYCDPCSKAEFEKQFNKVIESFKY
jgi:hypothetical protein